MPDEIVLKLLKNAMVKNQDTNRFLLDGFPRSVEQADAYGIEMDTVDLVFFGFQSGHSGHVTRSFRPEALNEMLRLQAGLFSGWGSEPFFNNTSWRDVLARQNSCDPTAQGAAIRA